MIFLVFKILVYLFAAVFVGSAIYTIILARKEKEDRGVLIVSTIFSFALAALAFYFAHWGIIVTFN